MNKETNYFPQSLDDKVQDLLAAQTQDEKDKLWNDFFLQPISKLCENLINVSKSKNNRLYDYYGYEDLHQTMITQCYLLLPKFKRGKGKLFTFLTICIKHKLMADNIYLTRQNQRFPDITVTNEDCEEFTYNELEQAYTPFDANDEADKLKCKMEYVLQKMEEYKTKTKLNDNDRKYIDGIIEMLKNEDTDIALLGMQTLRGMTHKVGEDANLTYSLRAGLAKNMRKQYKKWMKQYEK